MKKSCCLLVLVLIFEISKAQVSTDTTLDQLQVPSSPAFNMLGISPENIERPKNPTDFAIALGNATSGFTSIPKDYAIEFAPFWVFNKNRGTFDDFKSNAVGKNILQTAIISFGTTTVKSKIDSNEFRKAAVALKFSIFRGQMGDDFKKWSDSVTFYLRNASAMAATYYTDLRNGDEKLKIYKTALDSAKTSNEKAIAQANIIDEENKLQGLARKQADSHVDSVASQLKGLQSRTDFNRYGFKLDFAIGAAMDYPDSNFTTCYVSKFSSWITAGWEKQNDFNFLGVLRYSENINHNFLNDSNVVVHDINIGEMDYGIRVYKDFSNKLTLSFEYMRRLPIFSTTKLDKNHISHPNNNDRYIFSLNYKVGKNQNLAFTYGKNFDNSYIKEGNLIAALNLLIGFGSKRPVANK